MARQHLSHDEFFAQLARLFEHNRQKGHGSVYLTQKRLAFDSHSPAPAASSPDDALADTHPAQPLPILVRASNNKSDKRPGTARSDAPKIKLSTVVSPDALDAFYLRYADACKAGMSALKKRDRKKGKKDKKKKKVVGETQ